MVEPGGLPSMGSHRVGHDKRLSSSSSRYFREELKQRIEEGLSPHPPKGPRESHLASSYDLLNKLPIL